MSPFQKNIDRFDRVHETFCKLEEILKNEKNAAQAENTAKSAVADFLYSFNEFLDHWKTYLSRIYGEASDYYMRFKNLTADAFDSYDEYKITYALRNFQHVDDVVDGISMWHGEPTKIFANRERILSSQKLQEKYKPPIKKQDERFELFPIFQVAKAQLEQIQKRLMFYSVTESIERRAIDALAFKENLCGSDGVLLLGKLFDENKAEIDIVDETLLKLAQNQGRFSLSYPDEIPWGICKLLQLFKGTDYKTF